jgi:hypothetical protein
MLGSIAQDIAVFRFSLNQTVAFPFGIRLAINEKRREPLSIKTIKCWSKDMNRNLLLLGGIGLGAGADVHFRSRQRQKA